MGSAEGEAGRAPNEGPQTSVTISRTFWMGRTEVTQDQWRAVMGRDISDQTDRTMADDTLYLLGTPKPETLRDYYHRQTDGSSEMKFNTDGNAPVYFVSWDEAVEFCHRLNARPRDRWAAPEGYEFRLPTEAEWEYACRAGTATSTYKGDIAILGEHNAPLLDTIAWYGGNSSVGYTGAGRDTSRWAAKQYPGGIAAQRAVASKAPNAWGLYDMLGNVWEWCADWYSVYPGGERTDPSGAASGTARVWRGGSYSYGAAGECRAASRTASLPGMRVSDVGFRVVLAPKL